MLIEIMSWVLRAVAGGTWAYPSRSKFIVFPHSLFSDSAESVACLMIG